MKRLALPMLFVLMVAAVLPAQDGQPLLTPEEFDRFIDFHASLAQLNQAIEEDRLEEYVDRVVIFEGTVASATVYIPDPAEYYAELELITGQWNGLESVEVNRAYVVLAGQFFAGRVQERPPREILPEHIVKNMKIIVAGYVHSITVDDHGNPVPLLVAYDVRS